MLLSGLCCHVSTALKSLCPQVQFQKLQQLRLTQYHGGSLPNVSQLRSSAPEFQSLTNSDSALHTSALSTKPQDPYGGGGQSAWPASYVGFCDGEHDVHGEVVSFPGPLREENLLNVPKPLPKQLWETKEMVSSDRSPLSFLPTEAQAQVSPPPPYPAAHDLPQPLLQQPHAQEPPAQQPQVASSLPQSDFPLLTAQGSSLTSFFPDVSFDQQSMRPGPALTQQVPLVQQSPQEPQDSFHLRPNLYSNCGNFPNTVLTEDSSTSLFKDLSSALAGMPEVNLSVDTPFPLEEELQIEPLSLDGLNMLSDSSMGLLDPSVEETFRADRL
ncbi:hypothetical protein G4228_009774 [Cervus hanglu yarkandensis]|nr:hypothetical protein G4228_009774 [Cervus hanglu yarkandensis]